MRAFLLAAVSALILLAPAHLRAVPGGGAGEGHGEVTIDAEGRKWVCADGVCRLVQDETTEGGEGAAAAPVAASALPEKPTRMILGNRGVDEFLVFLGEKGASSDGEGGVFTSFTWLTLLLAVLGGIALNLTPCVLPMIPVNLIVIGKSPARGAVYGLGMAVSYGVLGALASVGLLAFGTIQSSPLFNAAVAVVFLVLALSMLGVFAIDLSKFRPASAAKGASGASLVVPFFLGALSAVLAGACVAPILISVIVLTARLFAEGEYLVLSLPFALGLGMGLPWPFLGAGMKVLPKPGPWMKGVNRAFGILVLCLAAWYACLAWIGWAARSGAAAAPSASETAAEGSVISATPETFESAFADALATGKPVFVDCWATWCKSCMAMEATTLADERVKKALSRFAVVKLDVSADFSAFQRLKQFAGVQGIPAYAIFEQTGKQEEHR